MLKGYKEIAEMAYDDCIEALKTETDEEVRNMLQERLAELDNATFVKCVTAEDWQAYISKFPYGSHREEAVEMISRYEAELEEATIKACKKIADYEDYLNRYPDGRFRDEALLAESRIRKKHRNRKICLVFICLLVMPRILIEVLVDMNLLVPAKWLKVVNVYTKDVLHTEDTLQCYYTFYNNGGELYFVVDTDVASGDLEVKNDSGWLVVYKEKKDTSVKNDSEKGPVVNKKCIGTRSTWCITALPNTGEKRFAEVVLKAPDRLLGQSIGGGFEHRFFITQDDGRPTWLNLSKEVTDINLDEFGDVVGCLVNGEWEECDGHSECLRLSSGETIYAATDGGELRVSVTGEELFLEKFMKRDNGELIASFRVRGDGFRCKHFREGVIIIQSGDMTKRINVHQYPYSREKMLRKRKYKYRMRDRDDY